VNFAKYKTNLTLIKYKCVEKCPQNFIETFNRCVKSNVTVDFSGFFTSVSQDLVILWPQILLSCVVAAIFSYILLILFRYAIEYIIWIIYIASVIALGAAAILFAVLFAQNGGGGLLGASIVFAICTVVDILILIWFRKRIKLVAQLFKEASKALIDVTSILFEPILTFLALILAIAPFLFFIIVIETAGDFLDAKNLDGSTQVKLTQAGGIGFARFLNVVAFIWFTQFIYGCQHFVIAGKINLII
jgi:hypothetical protein